MDDDALTRSLDVINEYCVQNFGDDFKCEVFQGKGRIMISRRDFKQGALLFSEPPLHIVQEDEENEAFLRIQEMHEEDPDEFDYEPLWYWTALCSLTEAQLKNGPAMGSLKPVSEIQQQRLLSLYHDPVEEVSDAVEKIVAELGLEVEPKLVEEILQAWILNCFEHSDDPLGYSAYFASSFVSHSCLPNAVWCESDGGFHELRARQDISAGEEVTISYLEEHTLLHSAEARKRILRETKLFECTCERCIPQAISSDPDALGRDPCRGFRCKHCGECGIFHPLRRKGKGKGKGKGGKGKTKGDSMCGVECQSCGAAVDIEESKRLLDVERTLQARLDELDEQLETKEIEDVMNEKRAEKLLKMLTTNSGVVGPQHWLCDRLWERLQEWHEAKDRRADCSQMLQLRVAYQRKAYEGLSAALAWTLEKQGLFLLGQLGLEEQELAAQVEPILKEAANILVLMFGKGHEYSRKVESKHSIVKQILDRKEKEGSTETPPA